MTARAASQADFVKLTPLMQANCQKMQYDWDNYSSSANLILSSADNGFFLLAETGEQVVGFVSFTFEWSEWRNGAMLCLQALQIADGANAEETIAVLKTALEAHKATLGFSCCGFRFYNPKAVHAEALQAI